MSATDVRLVDPIGALVAGDGWVGGLLDVIVSNFGTTVWAMPVDKTGSVCLRAAAMEYGGGGGGGGATGFDIENTGCCVKGVV